MYRILVADDEMIERKVLVRRLQKKYPDCEIVDAENGREVLEKYHKIPAEILILDIEMPGITGLEAAETLREEGSRSAIIFLTAYDSFSYAKKAVSVHALDYLLKPCDEKELLDVVDAAMHYVDGVREGTVLPLPIVKKDSTQDTKETSPSEKNQATDNSEENPIRAARMKEYIDRYYMKDIAVQDIAGALGYSEAYFCKLFKQYFGKSFVTYLAEYRVDKAKRLLEDVSFNIKEVGQAVGYQDSNYFAKVFRRAMGESPSDYRHQIMTGK